MYIRLTILFVALLGLAGAYLLDDGLDPAAEKWISHFSDANENQSRAYLLLMGLNSPAGENPAVAGRQLLQDYEAALEDGAAASFKPDTTKARLPLPQGELFCRLSNPACFEQLTGKDKAIDTALQQHAELLKRYRELLKTGGHRTMTLPAPHEPKPPYAYLRAANQLQHLSILQLIEQKKLSKAVNALYDHLKRLRKHLAMADTLAHKTAVAGLLTDSLELAQLIYHKQLILQPLVILGLNANEMSMEAALMREFSAAANGYQNLDTAQAADKAGMPSATLWLSFKPNMTINHVLAYYQHLSELSQLPANEFATARSKGYQPQTGALSLIRNYGGHLLTETPPEELSLGAGVLQDLDAKIKLIKYRFSVGPRFNAQMLSKVRSIYNNPYFPDEKPQLSEDGKQLCYRSPNRNEALKPCINL